MELPTKEGAEVHTVHSRTDVMDVAASLAQRQPTGAGGFHIRRRVPPREDEPDAQGSVQSAFLLPTLRGLRQRLEQYQSFPQVLYGLLRRKLPQRVLRRVLPIGHGMVVRPPPLEVHGQGGRNLADPRPVCLLL